METAAAHNASLTGKIDTTVQPSQTGEVSPDVVQPVPTAPIGTAERPSFDNPAGHLPLPKFQPYELKDYEAFIAFVFVKDKPMRIDWNGMKSENLTKVVNMLVEYLLRSDRDNASKLITFVQQLSRAMKLKEKEDKAAGEAAANDLINSGVPKQDAAPSAATETEVSPNG